MSTVLRSCLQTRLAAAGAEIEKLESRNADLIARNSRLRKRVAVLKAPKGRRGCSKIHRSGDVPYSKSHSRRRSSDFKKQAISALEELGPGPLTVSAIEFHDPVIGKKDTVQLGAGDESEESRRENVQQLNSVVLVKDSANFSHASYHELTQVCEALPKTFKVRDRIRQLNENWDITCLPSGFEGAQQSFVATLRQRIELLKRRNDPSVAGSTVRVKLSGDGTYIGRNLHVVGFGCQIVGDRCPNNVQILAVAKIKEQYDDVKAAFANLFEELENFSKNPVIAVDGVPFKVELFVGADLKFINMFLGKQLYRN